MALPQHIIYQKGGVIELDARVKPLAATVRILDGDDTEQMNEQTATVSTISTTLAAVANAGNAAITVTANTGMSAGCTFNLLDDPEKVLVKEVAGTTIHLRRPLFYDHISGANVSGGRIYFDVNSSIANTLWFDGRCQWNLSYANGTTEFEYTSIECGRYPNRRLASVQDICDDEPKFYDVLDREQDVDRLLDNAHQMVLSEIAKRAPDARARTFTGSMEFRSATAAAALYLHYLRRDSDRKDTWLEEFNRRLSGTVTTTPRDADQDGTIEPGEQISMRSVRVRR